MASHDRCCFGTKPALAQTDRDKTSRKRLSDLLFAEITLRSDEYQHIPTPLYFIFEHPLVLFVAMGNKRLLIPSSRTNSSYGVNSCRTGR